MYKYCYSNEDAIYAKGLCSERNMSKMNTKFSFSKLFSGHLGFVCLSKFV